MCVCVVSANVKSKIDVYLTDVKLDTLPHVLSQSGHLIPNAYQ